MLVEDKTAITLSFDFCFHWCHLAVFMQSINISVFVGIPSFNSAGNLALLNVVSKKLTEYTPQRTTIN